MSDVKKYIYFFMLIVTFVVASPFMVVKIWNSSELKTAAMKWKGEPQEILEVTPTETQAVLPVETQAEPVKFEQIIDGVQVDAVPTEFEITPEMDAEIEPETELQTEKVMETFPPKNQFVESDASYFDDALFIGDSRTEDIRLYGTLSGADYFCSVGMSVYKVNTAYVDGMQLSDYLSQKQYGKIYIMLGLNEISDDIDYTTGLYKKFVEQVREAQPSALIFIEANLHVTNWYSQQNPSEANERLDRFNGIISELANGEDTFYIDINELFDDENGALQADHTGDGVHPYAKYCPEWSDWLCTKTIYK